MVIHDLPLTAAGPRRISYAHASALLLAQALTDADARRARHFPALGSTTWGDLLRQLQPDVLVQGKAVSFDWPGLAGWVHGLAASAEGPALDPPALGRSKESSDGRQEGPDAVPPMSLSRQHDAPDRASRRTGSRRRTFSDIVRRHPRANGKCGFTVRELCAAMHISAASLTEARDNPGRLSLNSVVGLAEAMGESPLHVILDLLAEAGTKKRKKRKNRRPGSDGLATAA